MKFRFLPHTADLKFQAFGKNLEECFINSALALKNIITKEKIENKIKKEIEIKGKDKEMLLVNFLEEILFLLDSEGFILGEIEKIEIKNKEEYELKAILLGDNIKNYKIEGSVKAITYNDIFIKKKKINKKEIFISQIVVDV